MLCRHGCLFIYGRSNEIIDDWSGGEGVRLVESGKEWRVLCLLYADDLVLCGESE